MWEVDADVLESVSLGAGILGTGGGGNPYVAKIWARGELERGARFQILDPAEVPDDAWIVGSGGIGAPTVSVEKLRRGDEEYPRCGCWSATSASSSTAWSRWRSAAATRSGR
jgi:DUF917 family protein